MLVLPLQREECRVAGESPKEEMTPIPVIATLFCMVESISVYQTALALNMRDELLPPKAYALFIAIRTLCLRATFGT